MAAKLPTATASVFYNRNGQARMDQFELGEKNIPRLTYSANKPLVQLLISLINNDTDFSVRITQDAGH